MTRRFFSWWPVRLDNQQSVKVALLGSPQQLYVADFGSSSSRTTLDKIESTVTLPIAASGRCNAVGMWWSMHAGGAEYSTRPKLARHDPVAAAKGEWKQAVHYFGGETCVSTGDSVKLTACIDPSLTVKIKLQSALEIVAPPLVDPPLATEGAVLPIVPYHFRMLQDQERLRVYKLAIQAAVRQKHSELGRRPRVLDIGCGLGLLGITAALEGAEVWFCEALPTMRGLCHEVLALNQDAIADNHAIVHLLPPGLSTSLCIGDAITEKFDLITSEVLGDRCLNEGIIATTRHAQAELLAEGGMLLPGKLTIFAQPLELERCRLSQEGKSVNLSPVCDRFKTESSVLRVNEFSHRWLSSDPVAVLEIDLYTLPDSSGIAVLPPTFTNVKITSGGVLSGCCIWWSADLGNGHAVTNAPSSAQISWKQLVAWSAETRDVEDGDQLRLFACHDEDEVFVIV